MIRYLNISASTACRIHPAIAFIWSQMEWRL